jgi:NADP-dependent 3-hydroxy acid dehydrogenase YdfG
MPAPLAGAGAQTSVSGSALLLPKISIMPTRVAVVTGASRGIGRAIAVRLSSEYEIIAAARSRQELNALCDQVRARGGSCTAIEVDLTDRGAVARAFDGINADVLINNAGVGSLKPFLELTSDEWHRMVDVNLNAIYHVTRALLPGMVARGSGHVIMIGSIAGRNAFVGGTAYAATKHAVGGLAECLMLEVRDHGVKVSVVNPGSVATSFGSERGGPKPWALTPEDVAESVAHVLSAPANVLVRTVEVRALSTKTKS